MLFSYVTGVQWPFDDVDFDYPIQSPINIRSAAAERIRLPKLEFLRLTWPNVTARVMNTGQTGSVS